MIFLYVLMIFINLLLVWIYKGVLYERRFGGSQGFSIKYIFMIMFLIILSMNIGICTHLKDHPASILAPGSSLLSIIWMVIIHRTLKFE